MTKLASILTLALMLTAGCGKKDDASGGASGGGGGGKVAAVKLPKLGLTAEIPGEATVADGMGENAVMITGEGIGAMQVELAKTPQTLDEAKADAKMYTPKNLASETLAPNGWLMTFENKGGAGTNYWVDSRREIGGKTYKCGTTGSDATQAKAVAAACKSLR